MDFKEFLMRLEGLEPSEDLPDKVGWKSKVILVSYFLRSLDYVGIEESGLNSMLVTTRIYPLRSNVAKALRYLKSRSLEAYSADDADPTIQEEAAYIMDAKEFFKVPISAEFFNFALSNTEYIKTLNDGNRVIRYQILSNLYPQFSDLDTLILTLGSYESMLTEVMHRSTRLDMFERTVDYSRRTSCGTRSHITSIARVHKKTAEQKDLVGFVFKGQRCGFRYSDKDRSRFSREFTDEDLLEDFIMDYALHENSSTNGRSSIDFTAWPGLHYLFWVDDAEMWDYDITNIVGLRE